MKKNLFLQFVSKVAGEFSSLWLTLITSVALFYNQQNVKYANGYSELQIRIVESKPCPGTCCCCILATYIGKCASDMNPQRI